MIVAVALLLLLVTPAHAVTLKGVTPKGLMFGTGASNWESCASLVAYWPLNEASGTRFQTAGSCGSDCDLDTLVGTPAQVTGVRDEGVSSTNAINNYASCVDATCDELNFTSDFSVVSWARGAYVLGNSWSVYNGGGGVDGYYIKNAVFFTTNDLTFVMREAGGSSRTLFMANTIETNAWQFYAATFDDAANEMAAIISGAALTWTRSTNTASDSTAGTINFSVARIGTASSSGSMVDELAVFDVRLTEAEACRICSCWLDGSNCITGGASYFATGRNDSYCGGCTLPDANAACPT